MELSLEEATAVLGKTRRQVLYMIAQQRLPARKVGGRWVIEREDLQGDAAIRQRASHQQAHLKAVIEEALLPGNERRYTLRDLKAVQLAIPLYQQLLAGGAVWEKAAAHLRQCLDHLAMGCYRYDRQDKTMAYRAARDAASLASIELLLCPASEQTTALLATLEHELMPAFAGLLRRSERRGERA
jgi:excisionase family DNA binding protein